MTKGGKLTGQGLPDKAVVRLVKAAGLDLARYAGHPLRAGLATSAVDAGVTLAEVMRQTRHQSPQVALAYLRPPICGAITRPRSCLGGSEPLEGTTEALVLAERQCPENQLFSA